VAGGDFNLAKAGDTSNFSTPVTVFDSLGNGHVVTLYFRKDSLGTTGNNWDWYAVVNGTDTTSGVTEVQASGTVTFNTNGALYSETGITYPTGGFNFTGGAAQGQTSLRLRKQPRAGRDRHRSHSVRDRFGRIHALAGRILLRKPPEDISGPDGIISGIFSNGRT
jgi:flagellar hook protein FlgE